MLACYHLRPAAPALALLALTTLLLPGCRSGSDDEQEPVVLGNLLEPFDPPPLEELLSEREWYDRPVVNALAELRQAQQEEGPPRLSVDEALALKNDSPEDNERILETLGRVAPADGDGVDYEAEITLLAEGDLKSTNPLSISSVVESDYLGLTGVGLFGFDRQLNKYAAQSTVVSWQTSEDRMMDKVVMRDDLTWSDGTPITAYDVEFTFQAIMTDEVIVPAVRQGTDQLKAVKAYDDHTLIFFHKEALATNDGNMNFPIIPKHIYADTIPEDPTLSTSQQHSELEKNPVSGGPYILTKRVVGQEFVVERRDDFYMVEGEPVREKPYFKTVRFKIMEDRNTAFLALEAGDIDAQVLQPEQWLGPAASDNFYKENTKVSGVEWTTFFINWNLKTPYFADKRVREAMSYAMDYKELYNTILQGLYDPALGTFHPDSPMFPENGPEPYQQNLDRAESLLDEAGWTDSDGDGIRDKEISGQQVPFKFSLMCANMPQRVKICTLMKESLDKIGVVCNVKPTEFTVLTQLQREHKFQAALAGWGSGADPDTSTNIWVTDEGRNYGHYSNQEVDALFEQARREFDPDRRNALYGQIHNLIWEDQPYTWLFYRNSFYGFNKRLRGYNFSPRGPFHYGPGFDSIFVPESP